MACPSCAIDTLQTFVRGINIVYSVKLGTYSTQPLAKGWAPRRRSLYTRTALRTSSTSFPIIQPSRTPTLDDQFVPFVHSAGGNGHVPRDRGGSPESSKSYPQLHASHPRPETRCRKSESLDRKWATRTLGDTAADGNVDVIRPSNADHTVTINLPDQLSVSSACTVMDSSARHDRKPRTQKRTETSPNPMPKTTSVASKDAKRSTTSARHPHRSREKWQAQKSALSEKFGPSGWSPRKRLSPDALDGIRTLHAQHPDKYTTPVLADEFKISPEAIRRILKSKWRPNEVEVEERAHRWEKRGENIWSQMVEVGIKPPKKWRQMGVGRLDDRSRLKDYLQNPGGTENGATARHRGKDSNAWQDNDSELPTTLADRIL